MRYIVGLMLSPTSRIVDLEYPVRGCYSTRQAIRVSMMSEDLRRAYAAYAYPLKKRREGPSSNDWRHDICLPVTGKISMKIGMPHRMRAEK